ncbi:hypothetical protein [Cellulomonas pakistanensis]|uniref:Uncharacterized protein n=1 Tax=Cellulomonas pakistanensis TaxID=992287 RepID=A0A919U7X8_9CELL|nr:hypothetical protein [Cellulomonas pakistanensis]GIG37437.1 hypothetical protein Cpa01nite_28180 [Cellulomonas pakistanensis]
MRSSSADRGPAAGAAGEAPLLGRWARLVLGTVLVAGAVLGTATGFASAKFGDQTSVSIRITITPTDGPAPSPAPTATLGEPAPLP